MHGPPSESERAVLALLAGDLSQREIAACSTSPSTPWKPYVRTLYRKLGVSSRAEAVERARELGLLDAGSTTAPADVVRTHPGERALG